MPEVQLLTARFFIFVMSVVNIMRIKTKKRWMLAFTCFSVAAISACSIQTTGREVAESAAVQFHNQFNRERYREIYRQTNEIFKNSASEDNFAVRLKIVRLRIGTVKQSILNSWQAKDTPSGRIISLQFNTAFTDEDAVEDFVFAVSRDKAVLQGYKISSPLLDRK